MLYVKTHNGDSNLMNPAPVLSLEQLLEADICRGPSKHAIKCIQLAIITMATKESIVILKSFHCLSTQKHRAI